MTPPPLFTNPSLPRPLRQLKISSYMTTGSYDLPCTANNCAKGYLDSKCDCASGPFSTAKRPANKPGEFADTYIT